MCTVDELFSRYLKALTFPCVEDVIQPLVWIAPTRSSSLDPVVCGLLQWPKGITSGLHKTRIAWVNRAL